MQFAVCVILEIWKMMGGSHDDVLTESDLIKCIFAGVPAGSNQTITQRVSHGGAVVHYKVEGPMENPGATKWMRSAHDLLRVLVREYLTGYDANAKRMRQPPIFVHSSNARHAAIVHGVLVETAKQAFGKDAARRVRLFSSKTRHKVIPEMEYTGHAAYVSDCDVLVVGGSGSLDIVHDAHFAVSFDFMFQSILSQCEEQQFVRRLGCLRQRGTARRYGWIEQSATEGRISSTTFVRRWLAGSGGRGGAGRDVRTTQTLCVMATAKRDGTDLDEFQAQTYDPERDCVAEDVGPTAGRWQRQWSTAGIVAVAQGLQVVRDEMFCVHVCGEPGAGAPDVVFDVAAEMEALSRGSRVKLNQLLAPRTNATASEAAIAIAAAHAAANVEFETTARTTSAYFEEIVRWRAASLGGMHIPTPLVLAALLRGCVDLAEAEARAINERLRPYLYLRDLLFYMASVHREAGGWLRICERRLQAAPAGGEYLNALPMVVSRVLEDCGMFGDEPVWNGPVFSDKRWSGTRESVSEETRKEILRSDRMSWALTLVSPAEQPGQILNAGVRDLLLKFALHLQPNDANGLQWNVAKVTRSVAIVQMLVNEEEWRALEGLFDDDMQQQVRQNVEDAVNNVRQLLKRGGRSGGDAELNELNQE